jgi:hypothetical protein
MLEPKPPEHLGMDLLPEKPLDLRLEMRDLLQDVLRYF